MSAMFLMAGLVSKLEIAAGNIAWYRVTCQVDGSDDLAEVIGLAAHSNSIAKRM